MIAATGKRIQPMRLLVIDTETTGTNPRLHSLLSFAGVVWDDGVIGEEFYSDVWPARPVIWEESAKELHKNVVGLEMGLDYGFAYDWIRGKLYDRFPMYPITVVGHNVEFDIAFLNQLGDMSALLSRRTVDTHSIALALQVAGKIPAGQKLDLTSLCDYFNIHVTGRHTALGDAVATAELFSKLVYFTKWGQGGCHYCGPSIRPEEKVPIDEL